MSRIQVKTTWPKALLMFSLLVILVSLGIWQLNRAQEKVTIRDQFLTRRQLPVVTLGAELLDPGIMAYRPVVATGQYLENLQILLDNKVYLGRAGYHVLTPLLLSGSDTLVLVNRGWIPWGPDRQRLPHIDTPTHEITIHGHLSKPAAHAISFDRASPNDGFEPVWQNLDLDRFELLTGRPVHRLVLLLDRATNGDDALIRQWPDYEDSWIQRHYGYAVQWFGLALVLVVIFGFISFKRNS